ncbi:MAG TPA: IPT/TIG domain-containing protein [Thermoleophilia bacterium]|nr:IPT/TIG domain-containing protein [Thermoleophilia bacterium]
MSRKRKLALVFVAFAVLVIAAPALAADRTPQVVARAEAGATTYWYTGTEQIYLVPAGTTAVTITAAGAVGGADWRNAKPGGGRAVVTATVPLPLGTTVLYVVVGGPGSVPASDRSGAPGGFNGGGASIISWGGSGGGASDVRTQPISVALTDTDSRLVVAGGGGGAGSGEGSGGTAGSAGFSAVTGAGAGGSGSDASATESAAGNGGLGGTMGATAGALAPSSTGIAAEAGQLGVGGAGSAGWYDFFMTNVYVTFAGGGGGGYFGGGGGGDGTYGGGGGAGSSYWVESAVDTSMTRSAGNAYVSISPPSALPVITGFSPASGTVGTSVTLTGTGFTGATSVKFGGTAATSFSVVGDTQITTAVPAGATSGTISVTAPGGTATSAGAFTVASPRPVVTRLSPTAGKRGVTVTITGRAFGSKSRTSWVKFGTVKCGTYVSWSNTRIKVRVPVRAAFGKRSVRVTTAGGTSNAKTFTVKR